MFSLRTLLVVSTLLLVPTATSQSVGCQDSDDLRYIGNALERIALHGTKAWSGWNEPPPVLLRSGDFDCLVNHPRPPEGFRAVGSDVSSYRGHLIPEPVATAWPVDDVWSVAIPARAELQALLDELLGPGQLVMSDLEYERVILHEAFHAHQMNLFGGPEGLTAALAATGIMAGTGSSAGRPLGLDVLSEHPETGAAHLAQGSALAAALRARTAEEAARAAAEFLDLRDAWRLAAPAGTRELEQQLELLEGTARYADVLLVMYPPGYANALADGSWRDLLSQLDDLTSVPTGLRDRYAALGAAQAFVLDRLYPLWKRRAVPGGEPLESLLREAVAGRTGQPRPVADYPIEQRWGDLR